MKAGTASVVVLGAAACLGAANVCARMAFVDGVNVTTAAALRTLCVAILVVALGRKALVKILPSQRQVQSAVVLGLILAVQTVALQFAVSLLPVTLAILIFYTHPLLTSIVGVVTGEQKFSFALASTLVAAFGGLALVLGVSPVAVAPLGVAAAVAAAFSFSAVMVLTGKAVPEMPVRLRTFLMFSVASCIFFSAMFATGGPVWPMTARGWGGLAGLVGLYAVAVIALFSALPMLGSAQTAVFLNLEPVTVAIIAWIFLSEALTPLQVAGITIVVIAVIGFKLIQPQSEIKFPLQVRTQKRG